MPAYKDKERGTWFATFYYTDWQGKRHKKKKRGFARKKDAEAWEDEFLRKEAKSCDMSFRSMYDLYMADMRPRLRRNTMRNKEWLYESKVLPFFQDMPVNKISPADVRRWQSELLSQEYAPTYVKTINNQVSALFNFAVKYYGLPSNPARVAGSIGKKKAGEMKFWKVSQFEAFLAHVKGLPAQVGFKTLFWTGMRIGELLALTPADIDLDARVINIRRSFQSIEEEEVITDPKTEKGVRSIEIPEKLAEDLRDYMGRFYDLSPDQRIFPYTKSFFHHKMGSACAAAGMEKIRLHDLRHSHAALLIDMKVPILMVSERLGHENVETTLEIYGHLYQETASDAVQKLNDLIK